MMCFNQSILQLYETYKNLQEKVQTNDSVIDDTISIQNVYDNKGFK